MKKYFLVLVLIVNSFVINTQVVRHDSINNPIRYSEDYFDNYFIDKVPTRQDSINAIFYVFADCPWCFDSNNHLITRNFDYFYPHWNHAIFTFLELCEYGKVWGMLDIIVWIKKDPRVEQTFKQLFYHFDLNNDEESLMAGRVLNRLRKYYPELAQICLEQLKKTDENAEQDEWIYWANYLKSNRTHDKKVLTEFYKIFEEKKYFHTGPGYKKQIIEVMEDRVWNKK